MVKILDKLTAYTIERPTIIWALWIWVGIDIFKVCVRLITDIAQLVGG